MEITMTILMLIGAQAKNGCLIITMPEHPKFGSLSDRDAERIFRYLVGLARLISIFLLLYNNYYYSAYVSRHFHDLMESSWEDVCLLPTFEQPASHPQSYIWLFLVFWFFREDLLHRGFMLVLDRRREKWGTVKSCLNKVQVCWVLLFSHYVSSGWTL